MATPLISLHHSSLSPHILVMDESREVLALLHEILAEEGFSVTLSSQLLSLEQIQACSPALILMERRFDGLLAPSWDLVRQTRQNPTLARVPIVLSTTHRTSRKSRLMEQELQRRGVHVLLKPYAIDELLGTVRACLPYGAESEAEGRLPLSGGRRQYVALTEDQPNCLDDQVRALLFSDGRVVVYDNPLTQLANWRLLGRIRQDGELLSFLRIDVAGDSWTALVPSTSLEQEPMPLCVSLLRRSGSEREPLSGWPLFS
jgi:CheY-like chemotaxis protein